MRCYAGHILGCKRKWGTARGLIHYERYIEDWLFAFFGSEAQALLWWRTENPMLGNVTPMSAALFNESKLFDFAETQMAENGSPFDTEAKS